LESIIAEFALAIRVAKISFLDFSFLVSLNECRMRSPKSMLRLLCYLMLLVLVALGANPTSSANDSLPWEKDVETAKQKAISEGKPLFVMMTATWCGPCKTLEKETLPHKSIRSALEDFVWVQAFEDREVEKRYQCNGYPTLVFVDPSTEKVFSRSTGSQPVNTFLATLIKARKDGKLPLSPELQDLESKIFVPNVQRIQELISANDAKGLKEYLQPAAKDILRGSNYALLKLSVPKNVRRQDVVISSGRGREYELPESGLVCIFVSALQPSANVEVLAPGCQKLDLDLPFKTNEAVVTKVATLAELNASNSVRLSGLITYPDGKPAAGAIVRIPDVAYVKADKRGRYQFAKLPIGKHEIRVECPGGELHDSITLVRGKPMKQDITVHPVATVGIRWAIQLEENNTELTGENVREGEAYFSTKYARYSLDRAKGGLGGNSDFMIVDDIRNYEKHMSAAQRDTILAMPSPQFFFWLFDSSGRGNGLHLESKNYQEIKQVNDGNSFEPRKYFQFLRGEPLKVGQVYTVYCCQKKLYAKMQIIDISSPAGTSSGAPSRSH
jgi:thiol-disulfide isomerase/thioredoxin